MIGPGIFPYIYHVGSNFNLHSIVRNGLVPGGQNLSRRQTVFFLPVDPRNEDHKDPEHIDYSAPGLARYLQNAWKRHRDAVFWVGIDLGIREGLMFYQTRSNATILQGALPTHCIVKVERLKNGEKLYERQYLSPRPPPKISLKHDLNWSKGNDQGSTVEHQPVGKLVQQSLGEALQPGSSKPTQFPKPIEDRTGQPVTQEIVGKLQGELSSSDRAGQPAKEGEKRVLKCHDRTGQPVEGRLHKVQEDGYLKNRDDADKFNLAMDDENIDFNISSVPDAMVKRSQSISVQKIESHPQKEAIQNDLEQHRPFNPFSAKSKDAIRAAGNTELCEIIIEDQNIIMELSGRLQELQNEVNCMNDSKDFQDAESVRSGNSHVTSRPVSFPTVADGCPNCRCIRRIAVRTLNGSEIQERLRHAAPCQILDQT